MALEQHGGSRIPWAKYPQLSQEPEAVRWLKIRDLKGWPQNTLDTYAKALEPFCRFLYNNGLSLAEVTELEIAYYINLMRVGDTQSSTDNQALAQATIRLRLSVVRNLYSDLVRRDLVAEHPCPARSRSGVAKRDLSLLAGYEDDTWIPTPDEWARFLKEAQQESLRNRLMALFAYEGALRRETLVNLEFRDVDLETRTIRVRPDNAKGKRGTTVRFSAITAHLYKAYLKEVAARFGIDPVGKGKIFRSESDRNRGQSLTVSSWNKVVTKIAKRAGLPLFSTHTFRHLRLTHMAEAGFDILYVANYAGHASLSSTQKYIHLSRRHVTEQFAKAWQDMDDKLSEL